MRSHVGHFSSFPAAGDSRQERRRAVAPETVFEANLTAIARVIQANSANSNRKFFWHQMFEHRSQTEMGFYGQELVAISVWERGQSAGGEAANPETRAERTGAPAEMVPWAEVGRHKGQPQAARRVAMEIASNSCLIVCQNFLSPFLRATGGFWCFSLALWGKIGV
jgi:hypothetical protein